MWHKTVLFLQLLNLMMDIDRWISHDLLCFHACRFLSSDWPKCQLIGVPDLLLLHLEIHDPSFSEMSYQYYHHLFRQLKYTVQHSPNLFSAYAKIDRYYLLDRQSRISSLPNEWRNCCNENEVKTIIKNQMCGISTKCTTWVHTTCLLFALPQII